MERTETKHTIQGLLLVITGTALLLHTLGVFVAVIRYLLILLSLGLIVFGFNRGNFLAKLGSLTQGLKKRR
ncbi:hypothetical protein M1446_03855 [Candidatus Dependentiae bacterium]|nr:hypothetical protein [Candidatus Dependentiae bacterium]